MRSNGKKPQNCDKIQRSWRNFWCVLATLTFSLSPFQILAGIENAECSIKNPTHCSQDLEEGDIAPFSGQLLTPDLAINLGQKSLYFKDRLKIEVDKKTGTFQAKINKLEALRDSDQITFDQKEKAYLREIDRLDSLWREPIVVAIGTTLAICLTVFVVDQAR